MYKDSIKKILDDYKNGKIEITGIELENGIFMQFQVDYVVTYLGCATIRSYVGRNPSVELLADIWGVWQLVISSSAIRVKPSEIRQIDTETVEN